MLRISWRLPLAPTSSRRPHWLPSARRGPQLHQRRLSHSALAARYAAIAPFPVPFPSRVHARGVGHPNRDAPKTPAAVRVPCIAVSVVNIVCRTCAHTK